MIDIDDADLPGLAGLDQQTLERITGRAEVSILRLRYRPGKRAIVHLDTDQGEGALWLFKGEKAKRLGRRHAPLAVYDPQTQALFEPFPKDHRMPQVLAFVERYAQVMQDMLGVGPVGAPKTLRYRPGLSCTFLCQLEDTRKVYVKIVNDDDPKDLLTRNHQIATQLRGTPVSVAKALAIEPDYSAICYGAAQGADLMHGLATTGQQDAIWQTHDALIRLARLDISPGREMTADSLRARARESLSFVSVIVPAAQAQAAAVFARLDSRTPRIDPHLIHGDMKLEHVFLDGPHATFIDTESMALGPPEYDMAQIYGRLWQAELEGQLQTGLVQSATREIATRCAGNLFDWCRDVVALRLAKFYAQRPGPDAADKISAILDRLA